MGANGQAFINLATPTLIYIIISDKNLFDAINLPVETYEKLHVKTERMGEITVVIQYWLPEARTAKVYQGWTR